MKRDTMLLDAKNTINKVVIIDKVNSNKVSIYVNGDKLRIEKKFARSKL